MFFKKYFKDIFFWISALIGLIFMLMTLHYDINPVEGSVVPEHIQGTGFHIFLFVTSLPAWIAGLMMSSIIPIPFYIMACIVQVLLYGLLGIIIHRSIQYLKTRVAS